MFDNFKPDYTNILQAAKNTRPKRLPLYEHIISEEIMEQILDKKFKDLYNGDMQERREFFKHYTEFFKQMGYDMEKAIPSVPETPSRIMCQWKDIWLWWRP